MKSKLAIFGGRPMLVKPLPEPNTITAEEKRLAMKVLDSGRLSGFVAKYNSEFLGGEWVKRLEKEFAGYFGTEYAVAMNSATSALYAAVYALGVCPGDEVIVTPYTMSASATAIIACGGVPVFADIDEDTFCIDAGKIERSITKRTKAIMVVHLFGNLAEMDKIMAIARRHHLAVIEDCAQSPGARYRGQYAGTFGDIGVFSLNRHKTIQTGEGGVAITDDKDTAFRLQLIRNHAEDVIDQMGAGEKYPLIGWNYRMTEIEAAVGCAQIRKLDGFNAARSKRAAYLEKGLERFRWLIPLKKVPGADPVSYRYPLRFLKERIGFSRAAFAAALTREGFPLNVGYVKPIYLQPVYQLRGAKDVPYLGAIRRSGRRYKKGVCPVAEHMYEEELVLTNIVHAARCDRDIDKFIAALAKIEANAGDLRRYGKAH